MNNIIDFQTKKDDLEFAELISEYEKVISTVDDIEKSVEKFKNTHDFFIDVNSNEYLCVFREVFFNVFQEFESAFDKYTEGNEFSKRVLLKKMQDYDIALLLLDKYVDRVYHPPYDDLSKFLPIEEFDEILKSVPMNYEEMPKEKLLKQLHEYLTITKKIYCIFFDMLEKNDARCINWAVSYSISTMYISYYAVLHYILE